MTSAKVTACIPAGLEAGTRPLHLIQGMSLVEMVATFIPLSGYKGARVSSDVTSSEKSSNVVNTSAKPHLVTN